MCQTNVESDGRTEEDEITFSLHVVCSPCFCGTQNIYNCGVPENITKENPDEIFLTIHSATNFLDSVGGWREVQL